MDGHPWPTATPCCKTLSSHGAHAREFTCTITLLLLYTRSIYRFGGLAAPVSRGDVCVCACACALPCGHLLPSTPGGVVLGLVPLCLGNRLSNDKPPRSEGRRCFLAEEDQPRGIRAGFRCPLSFLLLGWRRSVVNDVYRIRRKVHRRSVCSDFERNRAIRNLRILRWRISFINLSREYIFFFIHPNGFLNFIKLDQLKNSCFLYRRNTRFHFIIVL